LIDGHFNEIRCLTSVWLRRTNFELGFDQVKKID